MSIPTQKTLFGKSLAAITFAILAMTTVTSQTAHAQTFIDVWDSTDPANFVLVGTIQTIDSAQAGADHYDLFSASGHPKCVDLGPLNANIWVHSNTTVVDALTFGFIFSQENTNSGGNTALVNFRIVDSTDNPYVSQSDDAGEAVETGTDAFVGTFRYNNSNTDGIAVSGIDGGTWTIIIDSVDFGSITRWNAAGGGASDGVVCNSDLPDLSLTLGNEYRLTPQGNPPSGVPVTFELFSNAGQDQSVNEGQPVQLDGSGSDPDEEITSYEWMQLVGTTVVLDDIYSVTPSFTAPVVAALGETLTFELTVTSSNFETDTDTVDITVVNVNHVPVADAGDDQTIAEGSPVDLDGTDSYDADSDSISYAWIQTGGSPLVALDDPTSASPSFIAPELGGSGSPGIVATLVFELTVDDGFGPGVGGPNVDSVTVEITNVNNAPSADAGLDATSSENTGVQLNGNGSSDPDSDPLSYSWVQVGGTGVVLTNADTATPNFTTPFVSAGGEALTFELTVDDGFMGTDTDQMIVNVQNANDPPDASLAQPTIACIWPPNHKFVEVGILGVTDPDDNATISIDGVTQDEPTNGLGDGDTAIDAVINDDGTVLLRAERSGTGDGRIYRISFTASDLEGSVSGVVNVCVPHSKKSNAVDSLEFYDSTL